MLVAALLFVTAANPSSAGWESVMTLIAGRWAVCFWLLFVVVGLVLPTVLECWMLWIASHELEASSTAAMPVDTADTRNRMGSSAVFHRGKPWHTPSRQPV